MSTHNNKIISQSSNIELYQIELTKGQLKALSNLLPNGFSLIPFKKSKSEINPYPTKKVFTNDGNQLVKKPSKTSDRSSDTILINKNALRDPRKRKLSNYMDFKYQDFEPIPTTSSKSFKSNNDAIRKCYNLLQKLKKHHPAGPFLFPVDVVGLGLTDYYDIIHEPMDLNTVETKLKGNQYPSVEAFASDIRKIWNNSFQYNMKGTPIYQMTTEMSSYFEKLVHDIEHVTFNDTVRNLEKQVELLSKQITELHQKGLTSASDYPKMSRTAPGSKSNKNTKILDKPLTMQEQKMLGENIKKLPAEHLRGVWDIVSQKRTGNNSEELEFRIETLPVKVARELERYVKNKISIINRTKKTAKGKELSTPRGAHPTSSNLMHHEREYEMAKLEEEMPVHHHLSIDSAGQMDFRQDLNTKGNTSPSNSSESSFISDSDSDNEKETKKKEHFRTTKSLQTQQELANFLAGGHGSMLNSFIVK